jgi:hypothetical protein
MFDEEKIILSFLYKRSGKEILTNNELILPLSIELGWFSSKIAKQFLQYCLNNQLLTQTAKGLKPTFDTTSIQTPVGFTPTKTYDKSQEEQTKPSKTTYQTLLHSIAIKQDLNPTEMEKKLIALAHSKNIQILAAALLYAKQNNISLTYNKADIEQLIIQENEE